MAQVCASEALSLLTAARNSLVLQIPLSDQDRWTLSEYCFACADIVEDWQEQAFFNLVGLRIEEGGLVSFTQKQILLGYLEPALEAGYERLGQKPKE